MSKRPQWKESPYAAMHQLREGEHLIKNKIFSYSMDETWENVSEKPFRKTSSSSWRRRFMGWTLFHPNMAEQIWRETCKQIQTLFTIIKLLVCSGVLYFVWALKLLNVRHFECYLASCYRFSCYYRFSDIAINSVNPHSYDDWNFQRMLSKIFLCT